MADALGERVANLEGKITMGLVLGGVIALIFLGFLGFTNFHTVPKEADRAAASRVDEAVKAQIDTLVKQAIGTQIQAAGDEQVKRLQARSKDLLGVTTSLSGSDKCVTVPESALQICWGAQAMSVGNPVHTRAFSFTFARPFEDDPIVVPGINSRSDGNAPAVYNFTITKTAYAGSVNNMLTAAVPLVGEFQMNYIAIGRPRS